MKPLRPVLALIVALALAACFPVSTTAPIGTTGGLKLDPLLTGLWKGEPEVREERGAWFRFLPKLDGSCDLLMIQSGDEPDADWHLIGLTMARLGQNRFLNVKLISTNGSPEDGPPIGNIPVLYRADANGQVQLFMIDEDAAKAAIKAGRIKGVVGPGEYGDAVITADPAALDAFMRSPAGAALFSKLFITLRKMR